MGVEVVGAGDDAVVLANRIAERVRVETEENRRRIVSALMVMAYAAALQAREDVSNELDRATPGGMTFAEPDPARGGAAKRARYPGTTLSKRFLPDTLQKRLAGRSLTWAGVTNEDLLRTIQTTVMEGLTSGAADTESIKARMESVFRGWVADGTVDPTTGDKLLKASKMEALVRTQASAAYNAGRTDLIMDPEVDVVEAVEYSAILDGRTSDFCRNWDGKVIAKTPENEALIQELTPPNHVHCRSMLVPITRYEEWAETERPDVQPQKGFGVLPAGEPMRFAGKSLEESLEEARQAAYVAAHAEKIPSDDYLTEHERALIRENPFVATDVRWNALQRWRKQTADAYVAIEKRLSGETAKLSIPDVGKTIPRVPERFDSAQAAMDWAAEHIGVRNLRIPHARPEAAREIVDVLKRFSERFPEFRVDGTVIDDDLAGKMSGGAEYLQGHLSLGRSLVELRPRRLGYRGGSVARSVAEVRNYLAHELGHACRAMVPLPGGRQGAGVRVLELLEKDGIRKEYERFRALSKARRAIELTEYAATSLDEFVAEGYAEFLLSGTPRPLAIKIGESLEAATRWAIDNADGGFSHNSPRLPKSRRRK